MKKLLKRIFTLILCMIMLSSFLPSFEAQASSPVSVSAPDTLQVQIGEEFLIPVTIGAVGIEIFLAEVHAVAESGVSIESQTVSRIISAGSSTRVMVRGTAQTKGSHRVEIQVFAFPRDASPYIPMITTETIVEVTEAPGQEPRPRFEIRSVSFVPENPDISKPFTLNVNLRNIGNETARDIFASFDGGENFAVTTLTNRVNIPLADRGQDIVASFQIVARDTHKSHNVTLNLSYGNYTQQEVLNLPLPEKPELEAPILKISSFDIRPSDDNKLKLSLSIQNTGGNAAENIRISLSGGDRIFPLGTSSIRRISSLSPGQTASTEYLLSPKGVLVNHPLDIVIEYTDAEGEKLTENEKIFVSFDLEPKIKIAEFNFSPGRAEGEFAMNIVLANNGVSIAKDVALRFTGTDVFPVAASNLMSISDILPKEQRTVSLNMKASGKSGVFSLPVEITYASAGGYEHETSETIMIPAESIGIDPEEDEEKKGTPRVMLERHTLSEEQIFAGSTFTLALYIRNNAERSVGNMKISLGSIQVGGTGTGGGGGGTVFSPLDGSSSSFFVDEIAAKAQLVKEVTLFVDPNAAAMTYTVPISIEFEDEKGSSFSVNESVNIPVLQETRMQVLSVDIPESAAAGQSVPLSMEFANTGRIALNNVFVEIVGDFPKENATYFVPRLEMGMSDFFQGMIIPAEEGTISGSITLTYLDALNQEVKIEHPFTMTVGPMMDMPVGMPLEPIPGGGPPPQTGLPWSLSWWMIAIIGAGVLLLLVAAIIIIKKIKAKRQNDFFNERA